MSSLVKVIHYQDMVLKHYLEKYINFRDKAKIPGLSPSMGTIKFLHGFVTQGNYIATILTLPQNNVIFIKGKRDMINHGHQTL